MSREASPRAAASPPRARSSALRFAVSNCAGSGMAGPGPSEATYAGDVIATGTPEGVAAVEVGDRIEVEVEGVGVLENRVEAAGA